MAADWKRFVQLFFFVFLVGLGGAFLLIVLVDPYDSGRFPSLPIRGVADGNARTAAVSRARDSTFNAAVIGNSRGQLLDPDRLTRATGARFVQLTVQGAGPREQLAIMRWFLRRRPSVEAIVLVTDDYWCTQNRDLPLRYPFPFWLYGDSDLEYLRNVLNANGFDRALRRIAIGLGLRRADAASGYYNYEDGKTWNFRPAIPERIEPVFPAAANVPIEFPAIERLASFLDAQSFRGKLVMVIPPIFFADLPRPGSEAAHVMNSCKAALRELASRRPGAWVLDFLIDTSATRDPQNFMDSSHYRAPLARQIEAAIASFLNQSSDRAVR